jgi:hypothetical protein
MKIHVCDPHREDRGFSFEHFFCPVPFDRVCIFSINIFLEKIQNKRHLHNKICRRLLLYRNKGRLAQFKLFYDKLDVACRMKEITGEKRNDSAVVY